MFGKRSKLLGFIFALSQLIIFASLVYAGDIPATTADQTVLRLNEFMVDNHSIAADPSQRTLYPAWIEIYNPSAATVNLDGLFLTDVASNHTKVALPSGLNIDAH